MPEDPPFGEGIDHVDLTETHERSNAIRTNYHYLSDQNLLKILEALDNLIEKNGTRRTLSQLTSLEFIKSIIISNQAEQEPDKLIRDSSMPDEDDPGLPPRLIEYGVGLAVQENVDTSSTQAFEEIADHLLAVMNWYFNAHSNFRPTNDYEAKARYMTAHNLLFRELATRRFVEGRQFLEKAYRAYKPFDDTLEQLLGFNIEDAIYYQYRIADLTFNYGRKAGLKQLRYTDSLLELDDEILEIAEDYLWIEEDVLFDFCDDSDRFKSFLDRMSETPGNFPEFRYPSEINPLQIHPLVRHSDQYLLPLPRALPYAIGNTFYYDLIDTDTTGEFGNTLGGYLEEWTVDCLRKIFGSQEVYSNVEYKINGREGETDVVVIHDSKFLAIECKTKKLTAETQKGEFGGLPAIKEDVQKSIGIGYEQADELVQGIQNKTITKLHPDNSESFKTSPDDFDTYHRIVVLGEPFGAIATRGFAQILDIKPLPYVVDVFDLQIITHVLQSPGDFLKYIEGRTNQTKTQTDRVRFDYQTDIHSPDEIDYLAFFKQQGMEFKSYLRDIVGQERGLRHNSVDEIIEEGEMRFYHDNLE